MNKQPESETEREGESEKCWHSRQRTKPVSHPKLLTVRSYDLGGCEADKNCKSPANVGLALGSGSAFEAQTLGLQCCQQDGRP